MSSSTSDGDSSGRFSDDLEKLIARAGAKADRNDKSPKAAAAAGEDGAVVGHAAGGELEGGGQEEGGGEGGEGAGSSELSARAMKFRAMISKLRPQKKAILVKASIIDRSLSDCSLSCRTCYVRYGMLRVRLEASCRAELCLELCAWSSAVSYIRTRTVRTCNQQVPGNTQDTT